MFYGTKLHKCFYFGKYKSIFLKKYFYECEEMTKFGDENDEIFPFARKKPPL